MTTPLTRAAVEKQLAYWRSSPGHSPTFTDFEPVAAAQADHEARIRAAIGGVE